jgi:hypothetical protein
MHILRTHPSARKYLVPCPPLGLSCRPPFNRSVVGQRHGGGQPRQLKLILCLARHPKKPIKAQNRQCARRKLHWNRNQKGEGRAGDLMTWRRGMSLHCVRVHNRTEGILHNSMQTNSCHLRDLRTVASFRPQQQKRQIVPRAPKLGSRSPPQFQKNAVGSGNNGSLALSPTTTGSKWYLH